MPDRGRIDDTFATLATEARDIVDETLDSVLADDTLERVLSGRTFAARVIPIAIGKAAWRMAHRVRECLGARLDDGMLVVPVGYVEGPLEGFTCFEAGHPLPDEVSLAAAEKALALVADLTAQDTVLLFLSGGGSALFEKPLIGFERMRIITGELLSSGADIKEMNTVRKHLSAVKGGRFAQACAPAQIVQFVLGDVVGGRVDMVASGPASVDASTSDEALRIVDGYGIDLACGEREVLLTETPRALDNVETVWLRGVDLLLRSAIGACRAHGFEPVYATDELTGDAREQGAWLAELLREHAREGRRVAVIACGETVVEVRGPGLGGRNQQLALSAAVGMDGMADSVVASIDSDGIDGPTDAAGACVDGNTVGLLRAAGIDAQRILTDTDSHRALDAVGALIRTGPTGTNVCDLTVGLIGGGKMRHDRLECGIDYGRLEAWADEVGRPYLPPCDEAGRPYLPPCGETDDPKRRRWAVGSCIVALEALPDRTFNSSLGLPRVLLTVDGPQGDVEALLHAFKLRFLSAGG